MVNDAPKGSLVNRDFLLLLQGGWVSQVGTQLALVTSAYWIKSATNSAVLVGFSAATAAIPLVLLSPLAGAVADRWSPRRTLIQLDLLGAVVAWALAVSIGSRVLASSQSVPGVLAANVLLAAAATFATPSCNALIPTLVPAEGLSKAMAFIQASGLIALIAGQLLAGFLLSRFDPHILFGVDGTSYLLSVLALVSIRSPRAPERAGNESSKRGSLWRDIGEGFDYIRGHRGLRAIIVASLPLTLFTTPVITFLPFYTTDALHQPLSRYGYLLATVSIGVLAGFAIGGRLKPDSGRVHGLVAASVAGNALLILALSRVPSIELALPLLLFSGVLVGLLMILTINSIMLKTESEKRGRVTSVLVMVTQGITPLAMAPFGLLTDSLGGNIRLIYLGLSLLLLVAAIGLYVSRDLRSLFSAETNAAASSPAVSPPAISLE